MTVIKAVIFVLMFFEFCIISKFKYITIISFLNIVRINDKY